MLAITFPEQLYTYSSASTSDSDEELWMRVGDMAKNKKLKNQLCRNFLNSGFCRYYEKCQFAHGIQELRQSQKTNLKYKTKQCQSYFVKGCCQYGERCNFLHRTKEEDSKGEEKAKLKRENFKQVIRPTLLGSRLLAILEDCPYQNNTDSN